MILLILFFSIHLKIINFYSILLLLFFIFLIFKIIFLLETQISINITTLINLIIILNRAYINSILIYKMRISNFWNYSYICITLIIKSIWFLSQQIRLIIVIVMNFLLLKYNLIITIFILRNLFNMLLLFLLYFSYTFWCFFSIIFFIFNIFF